MTRDIAIIGMAGRFPEADNIRQFFEHLKNGRDSVRPLSRTRKLNTTVPTDLEYEEFAYLENIDLFDYNFFKIAPGEAICMDPRQRLLLEVVYEALENAGYNTDSFNGSDTAVFVADTQLDYYQHAETYDPTLHTGNLNSASAGRVSRFFNMRGNAEMIDTACSSSLAALNHACNTLILGDAAYAVVCGAKLFLLPPHKTGEGLGIRSPDARSRTFSASANGIGLGEAAGALLLKPLDKAIEDKDIIHAVIKAVAVNQDGSLSASLTAPDSKAQSEVIIKAWEKAGIDPGTIHYIEAHGTGTKLGDPIEIDGLDMAFRKYTDDRQLCAVSSVKSNIGHTDNVAGLVGMIKAILSLKHKLLFPSLHFDTPNPFIDFAKSAVYVNTVLRQWEQMAYPARAGVSAFGLIGTNVHVVLEEAPVSLPQIRVKKPYIYTVSAISKTSLQLNIGALQEHLLENEIIPANVSYTLNAGRKHYRYRYAGIAENSNGIKELLAAAEVEGVEGYDSPEMYLLFSGDVKVSIAMLSDFCREYPVFNSCKLACDAIVADTLSDHYLQFVFQYGFYHLLASKGVKSNLLVGNGVGKVVVSVLKEEMTLEQGLKDLQQYHDVPAGNILERTQQLIERVTADGPVIFAEMGMAGNITKALRTLARNDNRFKTVTIREGETYPFLSYIKELYLAGGTISWEQFYAEEDVQRTELPAYQFDRKRCWLKEPSQISVTERFYEFNYIQRELNDTNRNFSGNALLVIADENSLSEILIKELENLGNSCILINPGTTFSKTGPNSYSLDITDEAQCEQLKEQVSLVKGIIHMGNYRESDFDHCIYGQLTLLKVCNDWLSRQGFRLMFISAGAYKISAEDHVYNPGAAMSAGFLKAIIAEYPGLQAKNVDLDFGKNDITEIAHIIISELSDTDLPSFISYRGGKRFVPVLSPLEKTPAEAVILKENDVYLVTGGAGGLGLEICNSIASQFNVHFVITGRTALASIEERKTFLSILEKGSTVCYMQADVADEKAMKTVFDEIRNTFGKLDGVIHAAGKGISGVPLRNLDSGALGSTLLPKVAGTLLLNSLCDDLQPDFLILFSSLNAIVPQKISADYAAANAFEDAFAHMKDTSFRKIISINWPGWRETGMSFRRGIKADADEMQYLSTEEGISAFYSILASGKRNVIVVNSDLQKFTVNPFFEVAASRNDLSLPSAVVQGKEIWQKVMAIWQEVLKVEKMTMEDDFFELGGHSLNGTQVISRMEKEFGINLDFELIYDHSTVRTFAAYVESLLISDDTDKYEDIKPIPQQDTYDVSYAQKRLWLFEQVEKDSHAYVMPGAFRISGQLDEAALKDAFAGLVKRHEILRTTFETKAGALRQRVHDPETYNCKFEVIDLLKKEDSYSYAMQLVEEDNVEPFNLYTGPLMRIKLLRTAADEHILLFAMHHIITDGWSLDVLLYEVLTMYKAFINGEANPLPPLNIHYKDYVVWQQQSAESMDTHRRFWMEYLNGPLPVLRLPIDFERPAMPTFEGDRFNFSVSSETSAALRALSLHNNTTLFTCLFAAYSVLLYRSTGQKDMVLGSPVADRKHNDLEYQIGFYINTVILRTRLDGDMTFSDLVKYTHANMINIMAHDSYPFDKIAEDIGYERTAGRSVIADSGFSWNKEKSEREVSVDFVIEKIEAGLKVAKYDLWLYGTDVADRIFFSFEYKTSLFMESSVRLLAQRLISILDSIAAKPDIVIDNIDFSIPDNEVHILSQESIDQEFNFIFKSH